MTAAAQALVRRLRVRAEEDEPRRRQGGGGGGGSASPGRPARARLSLAQGRSQLTPSARLKNALGAPQAFIRIPSSGGTSSGARLQAQMDYLSHEGELDIALDRGAGAVDTIDTSEALREAVADWYSEERGAHGSMRDRTRHVIVSMPKFTDKRIAAAIGRDFARELCGGRFGDAWEHMRVFHGDQGAPHTHIIVNRIGEDGRTLHIHPKHISVQQLRELQVEIARGYGIEMNATPRWTRGAEASPSLAQINAEMRGQKIQRPSVIRSPFSADERSAAPAAGKHDKTSREATHMARLANAFEIVQNLPLASRIALAAERLHAGGSLTEETMQQDLATLYEAPVVEQGNAILQRLHDTGTDLGTAQHGGDPTDIADALSAYRQTVHDAAETALVNPYLAEATRHMPDVQNEIAKERHPLLGQYLDGVESLREVTVNEDDDRLYAAVAGARERLADAAATDADLYAAAKEADDPMLTDELVISKYGENGVQAVRLHGDLADSYASDYPKENPDYHNKLVAEIASSYDRNPALAEFSLIQEEMAKARGNVVTLNTADRIDRVDWRDQAAGGAETNAETVRELETGKGTGAQSADAILGSTVRDLADAIEEAEKLVSQTANARLQVDTEKQMAAAKRGIVEMATDEQDPRIAKWRDEVNEDRSAQIDPDGPDKAILERAAAEREATEAQAPRERTALEALTDADKKVAAMFDERGFKGELMVERIKAGQDVDKATRDKWLTDDIDTYARVNNVSDKQASTAVHEARDAATAIYSDARSEIREIRANEATRPEPVEQAAEPKEQSRDAGFEAKLNEPSREVPDAERGDRGSER